MAFHAMARHVLAGVLLAASMAGDAQSQPRVRTANGSVEGVALGAGISTFRGIPFAAPPIGELRWKLPQPAAHWQGVRAATRFGPQCMQARVFADMVFRSEGTSEDCLYLNVWSPSPVADRRLPVLVYVYGGGLQAGDGSEPRYDGENMARKGIVAVSVNYRTNIFPLIEVCQKHARIPVTTTQGCSKIPSVARIAAICRL